MMRSIMALNTEFSYGECHLGCLSQISLFILRVFILNVFMLSDIRPSVVAPEHIIIILIIVLFEIYAQGEFNPTY